MPTATSRRAWPAVTVELVPPSIVSDPARLTVTDPELRFLIMMTRPDAAAGSVNVWVVDPVHTIRWSVAVRTVVPAELVTDRVAIRCAPVVIREPEKVWSAVNV